MIRKTIIMVLALAAVGSGISCELTTHRQFGYRRPGIWIAAECRRLAVRAPKNVVSSGWFVDRFPCGEYGPQWHYPWGNLSLKPANVCTCPLWLLTVVFAAYPGKVLIYQPLRRWRRQQHGLCAGCRYDLTGNESGVCPECGNEIDKP